MTVERTRPSSTVVVLVDLQETPLSELTAAKRTAIERAVTVLLHTATELRAPIIATMLDPTELGPIAPSISDALQLAGASPIEKLTFSACNEPAFVTELKRSGADAAVVLGIETHVSVFQTVRDLVARGLRVHVPVDGVGSRRPDHLEAGLKLCEQAGATLSTAETILFDWLVQAGTDSYRKLAPLVR